MITEPNGFDENARLTIMKVTGNESIIKTKRINDFEAGFYPKELVNLHSILMVCPKLV